MTNQHYRWLVLVALVGVILLAALEFTQVYTNFMMFIGAFRIGQLTRDWAYKTFPDEIKND